MMKQLTLVGTAIAMAATAMVPMTPAAAQGRHYGNDRGYSQRYDSRDYRRANSRDYRRDTRNYRSQYNDPCKDGDGGTVIGALAGGLAGNQIAGRGDRLIGTILGGAVGAVAGRAIDKADAPRGCYRR